MSNSTVGTGASSNLLSVLLLIAESVAAVALALMLLFGEDFFHRFLVRPKLVVSVLPRSERLKQNELAGVLPPVAGLPPEDWCYQGLLVQGKNVPVYKLMPQVSLDGGGPYRISWARTEAETYEPKTGQMVLRPSHRHIDLVPDEQVQLPMWYATRAVGQSKVILTLNTDPVLRFDVDRLKEPYVDFDLKFIGKNYTDKKARRFRLNAKSWDDLGLTELPTP